MSSRLFSSVVAALVLAMAIVLSALAAKHQTPDPLFGSEILTPVWPGEVLS